VLSARDPEMNAFTILKYIYEQKPIATITNAIRNTDILPETLILWIDENLPNVYSNIEDIARTYEMLSKADIYLARVRKMYYVFWSYATDLMGGGTAIARKHKLKAYTFRFPT
jgi:replication factor C large subunit